MKRCSRRTSKPIDLTMQHPRLQHEPRALSEFFDEALSTLGALCDKSWHDQLDVVAEGPAARLWREDGALHETRLRFLAADALKAGTPSQAATEVFPGCPLTFRLAETLRPNPLVLERAVMDASTARAPDDDVLERLWLTAHPGARRWRRVASCKNAWHVSLIALLRCETQAIDQHWSLHRIALSLPNGTLDEDLAASLDTASLVTAAEDIAWPAPDPEGWSRMLCSVVEIALAADLKAIRDRQERQLRREFDRIEAYFTGYEAELTERSQRSRTPDAKDKLAARLAATQAEREHRRRDQLARHEIRVIPHLDALLLLAEPALSTQIAWHADHQDHEASALYVPRARRWVDALP